MPCPKKKTAIDEVKDGFVEETKAVVKDIVDTAPAQPSERTQGESCATREELNQDVSPVAFNRDKLDEVSEAAINIFGGKELKE